MQKNTILICSNNVKKYSQNIEIVSTFSFFDSLKRFNPLDIKLDNLKTLSVLDLISGDHLYVNFSINEHFNRFRLTHQTIKLDFTTRSHFQLLKYLDKILFQKTISNSALLCFIGEHSAELNRLTSLSFKNSNPSFNSFLKYNFKDFYFLKKLTLSDNNLLLISEFFLLDNLETLNLRSNSIEKIENLVLLKNLQTLNLSNNKILKIEKISSLVNLENLNLSNNKISKLENLNTLKNLRIFNLSGNLLENVENISMISYIEELDLSSNQIEFTHNLDELFALKKLQKFKISDNFLSDTDRLESIAFVSKTFLTELTSIIQDHDILSKVLFESPDTDRIIELSNVLKDDSKYKSVKLIKILRNNWFNFSKPHIHFLYNFGIENIEEQKHIFTLIQNQVQFARYCTLMLSAGKDFLKQDPDIVKPYSQRNFYEQYFKSFEYIARVHEQDLAIPLVKLLIKQGIIIEDEKLLDVFDYYIKNAENAWKNFLYHYVKVNVFLRFMRTINQFGPQVCQKFDCWKNNLEKKKIITLKNFNFMSSQQFYSINRNISQIQSLNKMNKKYSENSEPELETKFEIIARKMKNLCIEIDRVYSLYENDEVLSMLENMFFHSYLNRNKDFGLLSIFYAKKASKFFTIKEPILVLVFLNCLVVVSFLLEKYSLKKVFPEIKMLNLFLQLNLKDSSQATIKIRDLSNNNSYQLIIYDYSAFAQTIENARELLTVKKINNI
ncbi:leucine-rich repeat domain-containing protein [Ascoidea rubescens DSM 1968]|uniref:L domain-like protein n=1 Tax=Ascoidea rubescens DSM 1968 TaxID=1344418 RepID=A0A1D2VS70_9ASCO|nr:L domain-like protein [Ascoidea rubescens DSM 1968]ODV64462.1 L domain-like protein [Ascoidea rubescens DSM 1968]